ncbi:hypothetical protein AGMMS49944_25450 [Spirochaetia bacterium]|nr:hypothetical protein AGMMS49944_25450 [Spirochaetia bacterium]
MSGKKASEVSGLLNQGASLRANIETNFSKKFENVKKVLSTNKELLKTMAGTVNGSDIRISKEALGEFPEAASALSSSYKKLCEKVSVKSNSPGSALNNIQSRNEQLASDFAKADRTADEIRNAIRSKSHYCDTEYKDAANLLKKYKELGNTHGQLTSELFRVEQELHTDSGNIKLLSGELSKVQAEIIAINKQAANIVKLREKAALAKDTAKTEFGKIDSKLASKFLKQGYDDLSAELQSFLNLHDNDAVIKINSILNSISVFSKEIDDKYSIWIAQKTEAENKLDVIKKDLSIENIEHPEMHFKKGDDGRYTSLIKFLETYCDGKHVTELKSAVDSIAQLIKNEKFLDAIKKVDELNKLVDSARGCANESQERAVKNIFTVMSIQKAMKKLHYDTETVKIDGNVMNGYSIKCTAGGETIMWEKVFIDSDGKLHIPINHTEGPGGDCHASWPTIQEKMQEIGIFIEEVTKDGKSVLRKGKAPGGGETGDGITGNG